jgi:pimeloyl-ACP methyl ester carboxylesterase
VVIPPLISNVELGWEQELYRRLLEYRARQVTFIHFDKRGIGISDRFEQLPTPEQSIGDIVAVMTAVGIDRANLFGLSERGLMTQLFASSYSKRVVKLVLANSVMDNRCVWWHSKESLATAASKFSHLVETWGRDPQFFVEWCYPSHAGNPSFAAWAGHRQRQSASPADFERQFMCIASLEAPSDLTAIKASARSTHGDNSRRSSSIGTRGRTPLPVTRRRVGGDWHRQWLPGSLSRRRQLAYHRTRNHRISAVLALALREWRLIAGGSDLAHIVESPRSTPA